MSISRKFLKPLQTVEPARSSVESVSSLSVHTSGEYENLKYSIADSLHAILEVPKDNNDYEPVTERE
jgi:hypothetical protein